MSEIQDYLQDQRNIRNEGEKAQPEDAAIVEGNEDHEDKVTADPVLKKDQSISDSLAEGREAVNSPSDYDFKASIKLPEGHQWDEAGIKWFGEVAYQYKLPKDVARSLFATYHQKMLDDGKQQEKAIEDFKVQSDATLHKKFGARYQERVGIASATAKLIGPGFCGVLKRCGLDSHYDVVSDLATFGQKFNISPATVVDDSIGESAGDDRAFSFSQPAPQKPSQSAGASFAEAKGRIERLMKDPRYKSDESYNKKISRMWQQLYQNK
jgi:hypothetical protein